MPLGSTTTNGLDSLLCIRDGNQTVAMRHAVFQHDERNTLIIKEGSPLMPFMIHSKIGIATTRTTYDSTPCSFLRIRQIDSQFCLIILVTAGIRSAIRP